MQAFAASSNAIAAFSPVRASQWRRSSVGHSPVAKLEMPRLHETVSKQWNIPVTYITSDVKKILYNSNDELRLSRFFENGYQVQDGELDQQGTVRSDVNLTYCQYGHDELLRRIGLNTDAIAQTGEAITFTDLSLRLFAPLKLISLHCIDNGVIDFVSCISTRIIFIEDAIFKLPNYEPVLEANVAAVWLDRNTCPVPIQPGLRRRLLQLDSLEEYE